ncbi:TetR/AcrR family transcriptional regulator [Bradyrhizobium sp. Ai1a-2]|uniref:TetR/AcrR family transcriptional regulator n=1 Tax=Bradyrhizobium sp. Ai1a-2 TaxID=196490 RepID=UPI0004191B5E|nr:TetR/AcrR family transcriptional regulator [Bradyrhizobium sp. Ai1a-2]
MAKVKQEARAKRGLEAPPTMREHGAAMRDRLVVAALEYVWDFGYGASTIAEIARHAGVPRGSVFYYFPTKDDIVVAAIEAYVSQAHARRVENLLGPWPDRESALDRFQSYFRSRLEARRKTRFRRGCLLGNLAGEVGGQDLPLIIQAVRSGLRLFETDVLSFLAASLQAGQIKDGVDLPALAATIVSSWEGALLQMKLQQSPLPLEQFIASFNGVFRNARA